MKSAASALLGDTPVLSGAITPIDVTGYSALTGAKIESINGKPDIGYMAGSGVDIEYKVNVAAGGKYQLNFGVSSLRWGSFDLLVNGATQAQYAFNATNSWTNYASTSQAITLPAGTDTLRINPTSASQFNINAISLSPVNVATSTTANVGPAPISLAIQNYSGISNSQLEYKNGVPDIGYVSPSGSYVEYTVNVQDSGNYNVSLNTASQNAASLNLLVNGNQAASYSLKSTGSWGNFNNTTSNSVYLPAGTTTLRFASTGGTQYNIGAINISPASSGSSNGPTTTTVGSSTASVAVASYSRISNSQLEYQSGVPDIGYVSPTGAYVEYALNVQTAGNYKFDMNVATLGQANFDLYVNGTKETTFYSASTGGWSRFSPISSTAYLPSGAVTLRFQSTNGTQYNLGDFHISPAADASTASSPPTSPASSNSTGNVTISSQWMTSFNQLNIVGSTNNDSIFVSQSGGTITVAADGQTTSYNGNYGDIVIKSNGGNDTITVDPSVSVNTLVYGGAGNSIIKNQTQAMATVVTVGGGANVVQGNGFNSSLWVNAADRVNATSTEQNAGDVHVVSAFANGTSTALSGQNLPDPSGTGSTTRLPNASLWGTGPAMTDVNQGQVADCYFLGVIQTAAFSNPNGLQQLAVDLGDGTYAVQFKRGGTTTYLRVDGDLPAGGPYSSGLEYAHPGPSGDVWALIMEKAYAEFRTGAWTYDSTGWGYFGQVAADFGIKYTSFSPQPDSVLFSTLQQGLAAGKGITVGTNPSIRAGAPLIESHQYTVTNAWKDASGTGYVTLRNPWGFDGAGQDSNPGDALVTMTIDQLQQNIDGGMVF